MLTAVVKSSETLHMSSRITLYKKNRVYCYFPDFLLDLQIGSLVGAWVPLQNAKAGLNDARQAMDVSYRYVASLSFMIGRIQGFVWLSMGSLSGPVRSRILRGEPWKPFLRSLGVFFGVQCLVASFRGLGYQNSVFECQINVLYCQNNVKLYFFNANTVSFTVAMMLFSVKRMLNNTF